MLTSANGQHWVPHNEWDRVPTGVVSLPRVAVVVPYYEQPDSLARMYAALAVTDLDDVNGFEVVVVDDGSSNAPARPPSSADGRVRVLRQPDRGCRPGAARNLGAASTDADVLVFLDADTLPEPAAIARLARWPAAVADALVVGRRRHADLEGWSGDAVTAWLTGRGPAPAIGADPAWLDAGYREQRNLLDADERSYRFVISGVMACDRALFDDLGGFSADRDEYGGEDWDLAARAYAAGAVLIHEPAAVAWHDEPDWSARASSDGRAKTTESMWLAQRIPVPAARGRGIRQAVPRDVINVALDRRETLGGWVATLDTLVTELPDALVVLPPDVPGPVAAHVAADSRFRVGRGANDGAPPTRYLVTVARPIEADPGAVAALADHVAAADLGRLDVVSGGDVLMTIEAARAQHRARRAVARGAATDEHTVVAELFGAQTVDAEDVGVRPLPADLDLAAWWSRTAATARRRD